MSKMQLDLDFSPLLVWLLPYCKPGTSVGLIPGNLSIHDSLGFEIGSASDCDVLLGVENGALNNTLSHVLETFRQSRAQKLFLFCAGWLTKTALTDAVLNVEVNLLDGSILLPKGVLAPFTQAQFSLVLLDKARASDGRTNIRFIDATTANLTPDNNGESARKAIVEILAGCATVEKDFRNVILHREPLLATYHCAMQSLLDAIGEKSTTLANCASLTKSPSFLRSIGPDPVELSCLSPTDFSQYGYTQPNNPDRKAFPASRIQKDQFLRGGDILLVTQSNVGKLCIIDPSFSEPAWIGSSFIWIVRPRKIDPRVLYLYLVSHKVQQYLTACSRGAALPALPVPQLKLLPVPIFDEEQQSAMITAFNDLDGIRQSMAELSTRAQSVLQSFYS